MLLSLTFFVDEYIPCKAMNNTRNQRINCLNARENFHMDPQRNETEHKRETHKPRFYFLLEEIHRYKQQIISWLSTRTTTLVINIACNLHGDSVVPWLVHRPVACREASPVEHVCSMCSLRPCPQLYWLHFRSSASLKRRRRVQRWLVSVLPRRRSWLCMDTFAVWVGTHLWLPRENHVGFERWGRTAQIANHDLHVGADFVGNHTCFLLRMRTSRGE